MQRQSKSSRGRERLREDWESMTLNYMVLLDEEIGICGKKLKKKKKEE